MDSKPRTSAVGSRNLSRRRRLSKPNRNPQNNKPQLRHRSSAATDGGASVSGKLEALRNLVPSENPEAKPEQLFRETADYIVRLRTQVFVLQKLVDFYGSQASEVGESV